MFCTNCGNEMKEGTLFCTECGTPAPKLDGAPAAEPVKTDAPKVAPAPQPAPRPSMQVPPTTNAPAPKKSNKGLVIALIAIIVALVLGGGAFALVSSGALDDVLSGFSSDKDEDDDDDKDKDKDDEDDDDNNDGGAASEDENSSAVDSDRDGYGLVVFDEVDSVLLSDTIAAYMEYCYDNNISQVTLIYYNADQLPELYCHDTDVLVYAISNDGELEELSSARSTLLVYGHNVTTFVKSASVDDAYQVLTDPNYVADYILPNSSTEYLTKEDLAGLTKEQLRIARNEIFARHGRMFDSEDLQEYFNSKDWYTPSIPADEFNLEEILNEIEKANADLIKEVEAEMGN